MTQEEGAGSLSNFTTDEKIQQAREMVLVSYHRCGSVFFEDQSWFSLLNHPR
jgi:hypothetical protein